MSLCYATVCRIPTDEAIDLLERHRDMLTERAKAYQTEVVQLYVGACKNLTADAQVVGVVRHRRTASAHKQQHVSIHVRVSLSLSLHSISLVNELQMLVHGDDPSRHELFGRRRRRRVRACV